MNKQLEDFIRNNKENFDSLTPAEDSWGKIVSKMDESRPVKIKEMTATRTWILRVAAALIISFVSITVYRWVNPSPATTPVAQSVTIDPAVKELIEAEAWYTTQINNKISELDQYTVGFADIRQDVMNDMAELDTAYFELKQELGEDIYKQEVVESMIQNYRLKLEILEDVLKQLKSVKEDESEYEVNI